MTILTATSLSDANAMPIGGSITDTTKLIRVNEALYQPNRMAILGLPVLR